MLAILAAEAWWREQWAAIVLAEQHPWITPWFPAVFADGTPWHDGNPIFSALCPAEKRGIRVILDPENDGTVTCYRDWFAQGEPEAIRELVVVYGRDSRQEALTLVRAELPSIIERSHAR